MWDDDAGYDTNDPKHPEWHGTMVGLWDLRDKTQPIVCTLEDVDESGGMDEAA